MNAKVFKDFFAQFDDTVQIAFNLTVERPGGKKTIYEGLPTRIAKSETLFSEGSIDLDVDVFSITERRVKHTESRLPHDKTCADCKHAYRCAWLLGLIDRPGMGTHCDWTPSRFVLREEAK